jgi:adenylate cyclase
MKLFAILLAAFATLAVYLFATAPTPLPDDAEASLQSIPTERAIAILAAHQNLARTLYTSEIVTAGTRQGLKFGEQWKQREIDEGPLPALFLREIGTIIQKSELNLGLFLGSDFPISPSNKFDKDQMASFNKVKDTRGPVFSVAEGNGKFIAMFPDFASVQGCVSCHNAHRDSAKSDWQLNDVMGATTWTYPKALVQPNEFARMLVILRQSTKQAYESYVSKALKFNQTPSIGSKWPRDGYYIPSADVFMQEFDRRAAGAALDAILKTLTSSSYSG